MDVEHLCSICFLQKKIMNFITFYSFLKGVPATLFWHDDNGFNL